MVDLLGLYFKQIFGDIDYGDEKEWFRKYREFEQSQVWERGC